MVGLQLPHCNHESGCETVPIFGLVTDDRASRCAIHKINGMIDIFNSKCIHPGCSKQRTHNFINFDEVDDINRRKQRPIYCAEHAEDGMINLNVNHCYFPNCIKIASFNYPGERKAISCKEHIKNGMVACDYNSYCEVEGCSTRASFNFKDVKPAIRCALHKQVGMINIEDSYCVVEGCGKLAKHKINFRTKGSRTHCWSHVLKERLKLAERGLMSEEEAYNKGTHISSGCECIHLSSDGYKCSMNALYNYPDKENAEFCINHKTKGMINKKEKRICKHIFPDSKQHCIKRGTFAIKSKDGSFGDLYCAEHKTDKMVCVYIKKKDFMITLNETFVDKLKHLLTNHVSGKLEINLVELDDESIINIINNSKAADKYRTYNQTVEKSHEIVEEEQEIDETLLKDKPLEIISSSSPSNLDKIKPYMERRKQRSKVTPVLDKQEINIDEDDDELGSKTSPLLDIDSRNIDVTVVRSINKEFTVFKEKSLDKPNESLSKSQNFIKPSITVAGNPISCSLNAINKVYSLKEVKYVKTTPINGPRVDVKHKFCITPDCGMPVHIKHDDYCPYCAMEYKPELMNTIARKTKEETVVMEMKKRFPELEWISDKKIIGGSSRRRPDLFLDLGFRVICVEVDENQHVRYTEELENKRVNEIHNDIQNRNLVFIRFNPDSYFNGFEKVDSCWKRASGGDVIKYNVMKSHIKKWEARLEELEKRIKYYLDENNSMTENLVVEKLFFDNCP